jgi:hypothetical protein
MADEDGRFCILFLQDFQDGQEHVNNNDLNCHNASTASKLSSGLIAND